MGEFKPYPSYGSDFDRDFLENARFTCQACKKECKLEDGRLMAEGNKMFALGNCNRCGSAQKFDVTNVWREE